MAITYEPIATTTGNGSSGSITFSSISSSYTDLVLIVSGSITSGTQQNALEFNSDTGSNYSRTTLTANGTTLGYLRSDDAARMVIGYDDYNNTSIGMMNIIHILNYSNTTTYKTALVRGSNANTGVGATVGLWRSTAAINSVTIKSTGGAAYATTSTFTLYGIKAA